MEQNWRTIGSRIEGFRKLPDSLKDGEEDEEKPIPSRKNFNNEGGIQ